MRDISVAFATALANARTKGIHPRTMFRGTVRTLDTDEPVEFDFWTGSQDVTTDMISPITGLLETRTYLGGVNLDVGKITRTADLSIQTVDVKLSAIAPVVQDMVRGHDCRFADVEIHKAVLDPDTREVVAYPVIDFLANIDEAGIDTGTAGLVKFSIVSDAITMLTRRNPRLRSYQDQKLRMGDEWGLYGNDAKTWKVPWGMEGPDNSGNGKGAMARLRQGIDR